MLRNYDIKPLVQNTVMLRRPGPKKKSSLVSGNRPGELFFITHPLAWLNVFQNICIFNLKKKTNKQEDKKNKQKKPKKKREYL